MTRIQARLLALLAVPFMVSLPAFAATFEVNVAQDTPAPDQNPGDGVCSTAPAAPMTPTQCTLRAAIQEANAFDDPDSPLDFITFADGVDTITLTQELAAITASLTITGPVTVNCASQGPSLRRGLVFSGGMSHSLSNVTLSNCETNSTNGGAGIRFAAGSASSLTLDNVVVSGASANAAPGGGLFIAANTSATVGNSTFSSNAALRGGGIYTEGSLTLTDSTVNENTLVATGTNGAGIAVALGTAGAVTISGTTISANDAGAGDGGGISASKSLDVLTLEVTNSAIIGNMAANGAGVLALNSVIDISNTTISGNTASNAGGGLHLGRSTGDGSANLRNVTISGNTAAIGGGVGAATANSTGTSITNTTIANNTGSGFGTGANTIAVFPGNSADPFFKNIVADNTPSNCVTAFAHSSAASSGSNVSSDTSCGFTQATDQQGVDVMLQALADNGGATQTQRILAGSPAIDAGTTALGSPADQRGAPAADGLDDGVTSRDAGAYEFAGFSAVEFTAAMYSEDENDSPAMVAARRYGDLSQSAMADVETADGTATAGDGSAPTHDYTAVDETLTWMAGDGNEQMVSIDLFNNDTASEDDETVMLMLGDLSAGVDLGLTQPSILTIVEDALVVGSFRLAAASLAPTASETDGTVSFTVERIGGADCAVDVGYATTDGSATAGNDFTAPAADAAVSFASGDTDDKTFAIALTDDAARESNERFTVALTTVTVNDCPDGVEGALADPNETEVLLQSDELIRFRFKDPNSDPAFDFSVSESDGSLNVIVQQQDAFDGDDITVTLNTADGSATAGADYTAVNNLVLTFTADGASEQPVELSVVADDTAEDDETFALSLAANDAETTQITGPNPATIRITDLRGVRFTQTTFTSTAEDGDGTNQGVVEVTVERFGSSSGNAQVQITAVSDTATANEDFVATTQTVAWSSMETGPKTATFTIIADSLVEDADPATPEIDPEAFTVSLTNPVNLEITEPRDASALITDDDFAFVFSETVYSGGEDTDDATVTVTVNRIGTTTEAGTVDYTTGAGSDSNTPDATAGVDCAVDGDYQTASGTLMFAAGVTEQTFTVAICNDDDPELTEEIGLALNNPTPEAQTDDSREPNTASIRIADNEIILSFTSANYAQAEGNDDDMNAASISVTRTGPSNSNVTVDLISADGTATAGEDYTGDAVQISFAATDAPSDPDTATGEIPLIADNETEADETVMLSLANASSDGDGAVVIRGTTDATLTITNDDAPVQGFLQFSMAEYDALEGDGTTVTITVDRVGGDDEAVTVDYAVTSGTATEGDDFVANAGGTLSWADDDAESKTFEVVLADDTTLEDIETINLTLSNPTSGAELGDPETAVISITSDDFAYAIDPAAISAPESGGTVTVSVSRLGYTVTESTVTFATAADSATAGDDYVDTTGSLTFAANSTDPQSFTVVINSDDEIEGPETIDVTLSDGMPTAQFDPAASTLSGVITIADDDSLLRFNGATFSQVEGDDPAQIMIRREGSTVGTASADFTTADGTAVAGEDYTAVTTTVTFEDGEGGVKTVSVPLIDDELGEDTETVMLALSNPTGTGGGSVTLGAASATLEITNDDTIDADTDAVQFTASAASITEGDTAVQITLTVSRTGDGAGAATVDYATAPSSNNAATAGEDYTSAAGTLSWSADDTSSRSFTVTILPDDIIEGTETFNVMLSNPQGDAELGSPAVATVSIIDNENASIIVTQSAGNTVVNEGGNGDTVSVTLSAAPAAGTTATVTITPANGRVTRTPTTLTFNGANFGSPQTVSLAAVDDTANTGNENVSVLFSASDNYPADPTSIVVQVIENDAPGNTGGGGIIDSGGSSGALSAPLLALLGLIGLLARRERYRSR